MAISSSRWKAITPSGFVWEQEGLSFIRERLPDRDPYRAWSNFEFIADDGSINEVDLLVFTPEGFLLVDIKSNPGTLTGDTHTRTWQHSDHARRAGKPLVFNGSTDLAFRLAGLALTSAGVLGD